MADINVTVSIPDEIVEQSLQVLCKKYRISPVDLDSEQLTQAVAQAVADELLLNIAEDIGRQAGIEEARRIRDLVSKPKIFGIDPSNI